MPIFSPSRVKPVPLIVTRVPAGPLAGENPVITGGRAEASKLKEAAADAVPPGVVTCTAPDAPVPTVPCTRVEVLLPTTMLAGVPPSVTALAASKFVPEIVIISPVRARVGEKPVMKGRGDCTVTGGAFTLPPSVVSVKVTKPAPIGMMLKETAVAVLESSDGARVFPASSVPPRRTSLKFAPCIVSVEASPALMLVGAMLVIEGTGGR